MKEEGKRVCTRVEPELEEKLAKYVPWGLKDSITKKLLELFVSTYEQDGSVTLTRLLDGNLVMKPKDTAE